MQIMRIMLTPLGEASVMVVFIPLVHELVSSPMKNNREQCFDENNVLMGRVKARLWREMMSAARCHR